LTLSGDPYTRGLGRSVTVSGTSAIRLEMSATDAQTATTSGAKFDAQKTTIWATDAMI
jgi:hypothetical protein